MSTIGSIDTSAEIPDHLKGVIAVLKRANMKWTLIALMVIGSLLAVTAVGASAKGNHKDLTKSNPYLKALLTDPNVNIGASESGSSSSVMILEDVKLKGTEVNSPKCHWTDGWNSGHSASGELWWFWDTHMYICPNKNSPTGWAKVAGGVTGRNCGNPAKPGGPPPGQVVPDRVRMVKTFGKFTARAKASEKVTVHDWCGSASASAWAYASARGRTKMEAKGNADFRVSGEAKAKAHARAVAILHCGQQKPPPPTPCAKECGPPPCQYECVPDHKPQISCTFPPHVYVGETQFMWCEASDPDGDPLTVNINGDSHLQVSSVIPVNQRWDKSPCPSGVNCYRASLWGKSAGIARIVATVTANGKSAETAENVEVPEDEF